MARVTKVELIDDMTGDAADETVTFGIDGTTYDIDLSSNNAGILRDIVADYIAHGRKTAAGGTATSGRRQRSATSTGGQSNREHTQAIREWAKRAGHSVKDRGRIPASVVTEFEQAHRGLASVG